MDRPALIEHTTEVFFVIDGKRLEMQACLLAPTLKRNLTSQQTPVAYVRADYRDQIDPLTRDVMEAARVDLRTIPGTQDGHDPWSSPYPQGNKILAAAQLRNCETSVFLDTDMVLSEPVDFAAELGTAEIGACVSDYSAAGNTEEGWTESYGLFDLPLPTERVQLQAGRRLVTLPYFNAGMIVFREKQGGASTGIGAQWLDIAQTFEAKISFDYNRANIDQLTLPILGYKRGAPVKALDPRLNFNVEAHGLGEGKAQSIAHYHRIGVLWAHPGHARVALDCLSDLCGPETIYRMLDRFRPLMKRKRLKRLIDL